MKLVLYNDYTPGVLRDDTVIDISDAIRPLFSVTPQLTMENLITSFEQYRGALEKLQKDGKGVPLSSVRLRAPLPKPSKIICMGGNNREFGQREIGDAWGFLKSPEAILDPDGVCVLPPHDTNIFHHEAELVVVIGKKGKDIKPADAMDHVFGYTCGVDVSARIDGAGGRGSMGKSFDTFAPIGPCIVTKDEIADPYNLRVRLWVDGELRPNYSTADLARGIRESLEWFTGYVTVNPGDILFMGTNHQGLGAMQDGEKIDMEIEKIGRFSFTVSDPLKRRWAKGVDEATARGVREGTGGPGSGMRPMA